MTKLLQHIEHVRSRLAEIANTEQALVRALDEALNRVDQKLLREVRDVTVAHEARRGAILGELHALAARIGAFPAPQEAVAAIEEARDGTISDHEHEMQVRRGDWREAAKNIQEDLDLDFEIGFAVNGYAPSH